MGISTPRSLSTWALLPAAASAGRFCPSWPWEQLSSSRSWSKDTKAAETGLGGVRFDMTQVISFISALANSQGSNPFLWEALTKEEDRRKSDHFLRRVLHSTSSFEKVWRSTVKFRFRFYGTSNFLRTFLVLVIPAQHERAFASAASEGLTKNFWRRYSQLARSLPSFWKMFLPSLCPHENPCLFRQGSSQFGIMMPPPPSLLQKKEERLSLLFWARRRRLYVYSDEALFRRNLLSVWGKGRPLSDLKISDTILNHSTSTFIAINRSFVRLLSFRFWKFGSKNEPQKLGWTSRGQQEIGLGSCRNSKFWERSQKLHLHRGAKLLKYILTWIVLIH